MGLMLHPIDHETLPTCCHVRSHVDVSSVHISLVSHAFKVSVKWTWTVSGISTNPIIGISWVKGPSSSSVMWPFNIQAQIVFPSTHPTCKAWAWSQVVWRGRNPVNDRGRTGNYLQMNRFSLRNNRLKFKTAWNLPIILEESIEYTSIQ